jgi:hypothetical protein
MTHKVHLTAGTNGNVACAIRGYDARGKVLLNDRMSYRLLKGTGVSHDEFRATPAADRCAHCCDKMTPLLNSARAQKGLPLYADGMTKTLA